MELRLHARYLLLIGFAFVGCVRTETQVIIKREKNNQYDMERLYAGFDEEPVSRLTLEDAIELALEHNLDLRVREQQYAVQDEVLTRARYNLLPDLLLHDFFTWRNKRDAATSETLIPGTLQPLPNPGALAFPAVGSPRHDHVYDLTISYSLIDFGVSYYRARQEANNTLIAYFEYERAKQNIIYDTMRLYWRYACLNKALTDAKEWLEKTNKVVGLLQHYVDKGMFSPIQAAYYSNQLLDSKIRIENYGPQFLRAKQEFQVMLGLPPYYKIELIDVNFNRKKIELPSLQELEDLALANRPELFGKDLEELNSAEAVRIALVQTFPDINPFASRNHDGSPFLIFRNWYMVGLRSTWNLLAGVPANIEQMIVEQERKYLIKDQRLALALSILAQVHMAHDLYEQGFDFFHTQEIYSKNTEIVRKTTERMHDLGAKGDLELMVSIGYAYLAQAEALNLFSDFASSLELLNNSIGIPFYFRESKGSKTGEAESPNEPTINLMEEKNV